MFAKDAVNHVLGTINDLSDPNNSDKYINIDRKSLYNTLTIAQFNLGAEHEHLNELHEAFNAYN